MPGTWETSRAVLGSIQEIVAYNLPENFWNQYPDMVRGLTLEQLQNAAKRTIHPENLIWIVVGDRSKIEQPIKELGVANVTVIDVEGNPVE